MDSGRRAAPRHTGLAIAGIFAIPFVSVTAAAWLGDTASSTDPRDALAGAVALFGGLVMGLLVRRLISTVERHVLVAARLFVAVVRGLGETVSDIRAAGARFVDTVAPTPTPAFVPAEVGRRGPPVHVR